MLNTALHSTIASISRSESARLVASIARIVRDVGLAEQLAQDVLVTALEQWPRSGVPRNPGAWLMAAGKHRAIDAIRRRKLVDRKHEQLTHDLLSEMHLDAPYQASAFDDDVGDDVLRLVFTACHPVLPPEARVALTLRVVGGLTTDEIARAYLLSEATVAQRIVRAKRTLAQSNIAFELPSPEERQARLSSVLEVIYLIFNEGYSATTGDDWVRPALCEEAIRLGRILLGLVPRDPDVYGLVALMEIQASRTRARFGDQGEPILLLEQDRTLWDRALIQSGLAALDQGAQLQGDKPSAYLLQAAIAGCHARATTAQETDWTNITNLYTQLLSLTGSPVVALNRAIATSMSHGLQAGLDLVEDLQHEPTMQGYHLLHGARADLLMKLGLFESARGAFLKAAELTQNDREQAFLQKRATECLKAVSGGSF